MYTINTGSFDNLIAKRGVLLEVFLWISWALCLLSSICCFYLPGSEVEQQRGTVEKTGERSPERIHDDTVVVAVPQATVPMMRSLTDELRSNERTAEELRTKAD